MRKVLLRLQREGVGGGGRRVRAQVECAVGLVGSLQALFSVFPIELGTHGRSRMA